MDKYPVLAISVHREAGVTPPLAAGTISGAMMDAIISDRDACASQDVRFNPDRSIFPPPSEIRCLFVECEAKTLGLAQFARLTSYLTGGIRGDHEGVSSCPRIDKNSQVSGPTVLRTARGNGQLQHFDEPKANILSVIDI